ncbi:putative ABC transport system ATP-binding protein [Paraburkholderia sp. GAS41]|uniref:ABC transporter ATP-binding protein n=1 Tax=Paraburkholderia sp. GAS41 TaxID=3035134 RepID=UPI003D242DDA
MPVVSLKKISKTYHMDDVNVMALNDVSLDVEAGRFTVLSGASGSGKTTLLNIIGCIDKPNEGSVVIAGTDVGQLKDNALSEFRSKHIGYIFQNFNLLPVLTAYENVEYPLILAKTPVSKRRSRVLDLLQAVGLADKHHHTPGRLSGGQRQRVAIARALATQPDIVLADEPTANLDSVTGTSIIELMRKMQRDLGVSFIFSSHDSMVLKAADDIFTIRDGKVISTKTHIDHPELAV